MSDVLVLLIACVFALAAGAKLMSRDAFAAVLRSLVPAASVSLFSWAVPLTELLLAMWLISHRAPRFAAATALLTLALFSIILHHMWRRRLGGCGCFGEQADTESAVPGLVRNALLILGCVFLITHPSSRPIWRQPVGTALGEITVVVGLLIFWACSVALMTRWRLFIKVGALS